jgi:glycine/D-amino acid oxidase-like deaminating enzyme
MKTPERITIPRDGSQQSPWQKTGKESVKAELPVNMLYDCLIIGGGITGITAALLLQNAGKKVIVAEAHNIGFGTTGGTSAHINTFADTTYQEAESAFGKEGAQLFADAVKEGLGLIKANVSNYRINCDFETKTGYLYAETEEEAKQLNDIFEGTKAVGVLVNYTINVPTPFPFQTALEFEGQAQFHPAKYLQGLARAFIDAGGIIAEYTKVDTLENSGDLLLAVSGKLKITTKNVIYATHIPSGINSYSFRCAPYRSYVLGVKLKTDDYPDALVYDMQDPYHYFRTHVINGEKLLLVGGNDHKTGHNDPEKAFEALEKYISEYYKVSSIEYRWSSQYYVPVDGFPYIGQMPEAAKGVYCATGYNGNGMMLGSIAGKILADLVQGKLSKY